MICLWQALRSMTRNCDRKLNGQIAFFGSSTPCIGFYNNQMYIVAVVIKYNKFRIRKGTV